MRLWPPSNLSWIKQIHWFFFSQYIITDQNDGTSATVSEAGVVLTENSEGHRRGAQVCHSVYQLVVSFKSKINWQSWHPPWWMWHYYLDKNWPHNNPIVMHRDRSSSMKIDQRNCQHTLDWPASRAASVMTFFSQ